MAFGRKPEPEPEPDEINIEIELWQSPEQKWRMSMLVKAGFPEFEAYRVSMSGADWHYAAKLLRDGCPIPIILDLILDD